VVVMLSGIQTTVLATLLAWVGLHLGAPLGLDAPVLRAWVERRRSVAKSRWAVAAWPPCTSAIRPRHPARHPKQKAISTNRGPPTVMMILMSITIARGGS
jgi:hypothetical protein